MFTRDEFLKKMHVEEIDNLLFKGDALEMGLPRVFGGQVLGQSLNAAVRTVETERRPHSLHAYFLRPGDLTRSIIYEVDPIRDGRSFSTRRVVAKQKGQAIFNCSISFQKLEDGRSHQMDLPEGLPTPHDLQPDYLTAQDLIKTVPGMTIEKFLSIYLIFDKDIIDMRTPNLGKTIRPGSYEPKYGFWFKFNDAIGDDPITCLL